jgi:hypothetical protein
MTTATKTATKPTALDTAWEAHLDQERQDFAERFAADQEAQKEAQREEAASAEEQEKLTATREAADKRLTEVLRSAETDLQVFAGVVQAALIASDESYNAGVALGIHGVSSATRDRISDRISHVLRVVANLPDFQQSMSPSGRTPLGEAAHPRPLESATPLREQWNIHQPFTNDDPGYPGQLLTNRPIVQRFLRGDDGEWVEVAVGAWKLEGDPA